MTALPPALRLACALAAQLLLVLPGLASPVVRVRQGLVRGSAMTSLRGRRFLAFRGVPYARPPLGDLRFAPPEDALPWSGVLDATQDGAMCVQKNYLVAPYELQGQEDCLFVNVYTPKANATDGDLLDVMVFIHGGGFFSGSGASYLYGPQFLMDKDVVLVTFNYRLGALGFLSTGDRWAPGNYGLKDQVAALRWVQANIRQFGGDPSSVTLFGQSAGGSCVHYHMLSPMSKGLFHRAISQSGTALCKFALPADGRPLAERQALLLGCPHRDARALVACLRRVDASRIVESGDAFHTWSVHPLNVFGPVVEADVSPGEERFLPESPYCAIQRRAFSYVPWLQGTVLGEGLILAGQVLANATLLADLNARWDSLAPELLQLRQSCSSHEVAAQLWRNVSAFYLDGGLPLAPDNAQGFVNAFTDRSFKYASRQASLLHAAAGHDSVFSYHFSYRGNRTFGAVFAPGLAVDYGPYHCDDLLYLFNILGSYTPDEPDYRVMDTLVTMWTNFAKYGNPSEGSPGLEGVTEARWKPVEVPASAAEPRHVRYLAIDAAGDGDDSRALRLQMKRDLEQERMRFWEEAPIAENSLCRC
ncbi:juvenile hormone esterase-like isoform X2 [Bacillus rossius redtenbacheri]|uniref:juvenile hormone esterase-like isoform X2 n=1 Tax=Bacillus rossius redtenbacheri TaxID=93214 RepID=UPI002FDD5ACE